MNNNQFYMAHVETLREFCKFHLETFARVIERDGATMLIPAKTCYEHDKKEKDPSMWLVMRDLVGRVYFLDNTETKLNQVEMHLSTNANFYFRVIESCLYKENIESIMTGRMTADEWIDEFNRSIAAVDDPTRIIIAYYIIGG